MIELVKRYVRDKYEILIFPSCDEINNQYAVTVIIYINEQTYTIPYVCGTKEELVSKMKSLDVPEEREAFFRQVDNQINNSTAKPDNEQPTEGTDT